MAEAFEVLQALGFAEPDGPLNESIRLRIDTPLRMDLDRIEAVIRGAGYREISRSDLIRAAINSFVEGFREQIPELDKVALPEERHSGLPDEAPVTHPA